MVGTCESRFPCISSYCVDLGSRCSGCQRKRSWMRLEEAATSTNRRGVKEADDDELEPRSSPAAVFTQFGRTDPAETADIDLPKLEVKSSSRLGLPPLDLSLFGCSHQTRGRSVRFSENVCDLAFEVSASHRFDSVLAQNIN